MKQNWSAFSWSSSFFPGTGTGVRCLGERTNHGTPASFRRKTGHKSAIYRYEKICSRVVDTSSRTCDPDCFFRCVIGFAVRRRRDDNYRLKICTLLSPEFGHHCIAKLILVHKYAILVTVHGGTATPQMCVH